MMSPEQLADGLAAAWMKSRTIAPKEADHILRGWQSRSWRVCFAVCMGELAWHAHWVGTLRNARPGQWVLVAGETTNMLSTDQYKEIILVEDEELVGLRFRQPDGGTPGFEVNLFIDKNDGLDEDALPLISRIIQ
jgi:hypothetical protein